MAARTRRTRFAASFVAVVAAGCSHDHPSGTGPGTASDDTKPPPTTQTWYVHQDGATCWATPEVHCPPPGPNSPTCNPPAPMQMPCPPNAPPDGFQVVSFDQGNTCFLRDSQTQVTCPSYDAPKPPPAPPDAAPADAAQAAVELRSWEITQGDHTCYAQLVAGISCPAGATCNPPAPTKVSCPPYYAGNAVIEKVPGKCSMLLVMGGGNCPPNLHCNPPPPRQVDLPCPGSK